MTMLKKWPGMSMRGLTLAAALAAAGVTLTPAPAAAQDQIFVPLLTYRTGGFAGSGDRSRNERWKSARR